MGNVGIPVMPSDEANGPDHADSTSPGSTPEACETRLRTETHCRPVRYLRKYPEVEMSRQMRGNVQATVFRRCNAQAMHRQDAGTGGREAPATRTRNGERGRSSQ